MDGVEMQNPRAIQCPYCHARPSRLCVTASGTPMSSYHKMREQARREFGSKFGKKVPNMVNVFFPVADAFSHPQGVQTPQAVPVPQGAIDWKEQYNALLTHHLALQEQYKATCTNLESREYQIMTLCNILGGIAEEQLESTIRTLYRVVPPIPVETLRP